MISYNGNRKKRIDIIIGKLNDCIRGNTTMNKDD